MQSSRIFSKVLSLNSSLCLSEIVNPTVVSSERSMLWYLAKLGYQNCIVVSTRLIFVLQRPSCLLPMQLRRENACSKARRSSNKSSVPLPPKKTKESITDDATRHSVPNGWRTRNLSYSALVRDEQALFVVQAYVIIPNCRDALTIPSLLGPAIVMLAYISPIAGSAWACGTSSEGVMSFGSAESNATATIFNAWLSNMPHVLLSVTYMSLDSFCTVLTGAEE